MGLLPLTYRRPSYVKKPESRGAADADAHDEQSQRDDNALESVKSSSSGGIPPALSFDRIVQGGTCPPCTIRDFMNYLIYVERSAENLQFFLWYKDYEKRFFSNIKSSDVDLSREWTQEMEDQAILRLKKEHADKARQRSAKKPDDSLAKIFEGTDFEKPDGIQSRKQSSVKIQTFNGSGGGDPFSTPPTTPVGIEPHHSHSDYISSNGATHRSQANLAFASAGAKAPFTIQPFREELDRVITTYIMPGAPRQLNLSDRERKATIQALAYTTHPSAFRVAVNSVESCLRLQAHPNFIRWTICNGNPMRVTFARGLGVGTILISTVAAVLLTLSKAPKGFRAVPAVGWVIGIATLVAAYKGMCVVLHGLHHQHVRPWELFVVDEEYASSEEKGKNFDSFGGGNSFETEPWVVKYKQRNVIRKIFDREIWIQEPALRQIQDTIFVQSVLFAFICAGVLVAIFVNIPGGNFF